MTNSHTLLLLLVTNSLVLATNTHCTETYTSPDGRNCTLCPAGTHLHAHCEPNDARASCVQCPRDHFQSECNRALSCEPCRASCGPYLTKVQNCTPYDDIVCQCAEGRFWFRETENDGVCLPHDPCPPGYGLLHNGTHLSDTDCEPCIPTRTFSSEADFTPCQACSTTCDVYKIECSPLQDAQCGHAVTEEIEGQTTDHSCQSEGPNLKTIFIAVGTCISLQVLVIIGVGVCVFIYKRKKQNEQSQRARENPPTEEGGRNAEGFEKIPLEAMNQQVTTNNEQEAPQPVANGTVPNGAAGHDTQGIEQKERGNAEQSTPVGNQGACLASSDLKSKDKLANETEPNIDRSPIAEETDQDSSIAKDGTTDKHTIGVHDNSGDYSNLHAQETNESMSKPYKSNL